ncbi:MAG: tRNA uridine-5-carboxymethylaminomethyl(34) synthesis GTPase MnmE [Betaproteobacteria bacterium]
MSYAPDAIAAIATAPGRGGIGVVRISGRDLSRVMQGVIGRELTPRVAVVARFLGADGEALDRGLALWFPAPASYTGENVLELHGHGGPAVLGLVLARCLELGARIAQPGEFTQRAFLNDKFDLAQAESVADLIDAGSAAAARAAGRSLSGEFSRYTHALVAALVELRALTEATLDFPDEDIDFLRTANAAQRLAALQGQVSSLLARSRQGVLLRDGLAVVIVGAPNVGKSSLLNRLAGDDIAIVTDVPGTTRDAIRSEIDVRGVPLHVVDTAGVRESTDAVETIGIARTWEAVARADLALVVTDARDTDDAHGALLAGLDPALPRIVVRNKIDLMGAGPRRQSLEGERREVWMSARTGVGLDLLQDAVLEVAGASEDMQGAFLARERHVQAIIVAQRHLDSATAQLAIPSIELVAEELRAAQDALSSITGAFGSDDLLGEIFGRFCIGK